MHVASMLTPTGLALFIDGQNLTVNKDHPNYKAVQTALKEKRYEDLPGLMDLPTAIATFVGKGEGFKTVDGIVFLNDEPFGEAVSEKVLRMINDGYQPQPLYNFLRKVRENPSFAAQEELLLFWTANGGMIHEDGDILAYKAVDENYKDMHSHTIDNSVRQTVTMPRHQVDDCRERACSRGLHFAAQDYVARMYTGGSRMMVLKINPRDVVSIPSDYNNQKGRCCRYEVIAELAKTSDSLPAKEVYTDDDIEAADKSGEISSSRIRDRVNKVLAELTGQTADEIGHRGTTQFGYADEGDLEILPSEAVDAFTKEFAAEGLSFEISDFLVGITVNDVVEFVEDIVAKIEDATEDEWIGDYSDEDVIEEHESPDEESWLDDMMEALKDNILTRKLNTSVEFRNRLTEMGLDPKSDAVREAARRANIVQWL